jgi:hypothetical protein
LSFWTDFQGSLGSGQFYKDIFNRPVSKAWRYFFILMAIVSLLFTSLMSAAFIRIYGDFASFMRESLPTISFEKGQITNMPQDHIAKEFSKWSIRIDAIYTDSISARADSLDLPSNKTCLYIGPQKAFLIQDKSTTAFEYPLSYTKTITAEELQKNKVYVYPLLFVFALILNIIKYLIFSILYVLIISLIVVFKYRNVELNYIKGIQAGLYLVTIQVLISTLLGLAGISIPYGFLWYILFYIVYVGVFVNLNFSEKTRDVLPN